MALYTCTVLLLLGFALSTARVHNEYLINEPLPSHSVYQEGIFDVGSFSVEQSPLPLLILAPKQAGQYPLVIFHHGYFLKNSIFSQLLTHISSHGYIIVAPQRSESIFNTDATGDIQRAADVIQWIADNLYSLFPYKWANVTPDLRKLVLIGHSKGGKIAFALALKIHSNVSLPFSALVGLDPVDGTISEQTKPPVLNTGAFMLPFPVLTIGTGLGSKRVLPFVPVCAPEKFGHFKFFNECGNTAFDITALEYGHMDFVDDLSIWDAQNLYVTACKQNVYHNREPMRRFTAGVVVAFLKAALFNETEEFKDITENPSKAPLTVLIKWKV